MIVVKVSRRAIRIALMGIVSCLFLCSDWAFGSETAELKVKIRELEKRLEQLENQRTIQPQEVKSETEEIHEFRRKLEILATEIEYLRSGETEILVTDDQSRALGLGPSAVSIYRKKKGVSIAGYGEMLYENFNDYDESGQAVRKGAKFDFLRQIIYTGYRFSDRFIFNSEIEFEHASTSLGGSASVEFAYLDYVANEHLTLRGGLLLIPMGLVNEFHEPNVFLGARRPETEKYIIPTTWRENGFGAIGSAGVFNYRVYLVNGLDGWQFTSNGLRGGRQKGAKAKASNMAFVGRLDMEPVPGVFFGGSIYKGGSGQGQVRGNGRKVNIDTTIHEVHFHSQLSGFDIRGLYARALVDDVAEVNEVLGFHSNQSIGKAMTGGYIQLGYNVFSQLSQKLDVTPYYRFEQLNTQAQVPGGFWPNPLHDRNFHSLGVAFHPIYNVVFKSDYQWVRNTAKKGLNQFNISMGYSF